MDRKDRTDPNEPLELRSFEALSPESQIILFGAEGWEAGQFTLSVILFLSVRLLRTQMPRPLSFRGHRGSLGGGTEFRI